MSSCPVLCDIIYITESNVCNTNRVFHILKMIFHSYSPGMKSDCAAFKS